MTLTLPRTAIADDTGEDAARIAADLGQVLDEILEDAAHGLVSTLARHRLDPQQLHVLRAVDASLGPDTIGELVGRTGLDPVVVAGLVDGLAARRLLADPGDGYALTPAGQRVLLDVARARQADLRAFVEGLGPGRRRRIDAALHLLSRELDAR